MNDAEKRNAIAAIVTDEMQRHGEFAIHSFRYGLADEVLRLIAQRCADKLATLAAYDRRGGPPTDPCYCGTMDQGERDSRGLHMRSCCGYT